MKAYLGNPAIKEKLLAELQKHYEADAIVQGVYGRFDDWDKQTGFRGCAVGCTLHAMGAKEYFDAHESYEPLLGIPQMLARFQDSIFEGLPVKDAREWPRQFVEAIPVGADLSTVGDKLILLFLSDPEHGVLQYANDDGRPAIEAVIALYKRKIAGESITEDEWNAAAYAAARAARAAAAAAYAAARAAYAAADAAADAAYAAYAAADAAADAAYAAARAAADAAYAAARAAADAAYAAAYAADFWMWLRDQLLMLLREATPVHIAAS